MKLNLRQGVVGLVAALASVATTAALCVTPSSAAPAATSNPQGVQTVSPATASGTADGSITRSEMYARAQSWINKTAYSQSTYKNAPDQPVGPYRTDCSGFVSMAWGLGSSRVTQTLPQVAHQIATADLQTGDILDYNSTNDPVNGSHVIMFVRWTGEVGGQMIIDEEAGEVGATERTVSYPYGNGSAMDGTSAWIPYRYNNVVDDSAPVRPRYDVFSVESGSQNLTHQYFVDGTRSEERLGRMLSAGPAATFHDGRYDVFAVDANGDLAQNYFVPGSAWSGWTVVRSDRALLKSGGGVTAVYHDGTYDVFAISADGALVETVHPAGGVWSGWVTLSAAGAVSGQPSATASAGRVDVFALGGGGELVHRTYTGTWSAWEHLGGVLRYGVSATYHDGRFDVFGVNTSDVVVQKYKESGVAWTAFTSIGSSTQMSTGPAATYHDGRYDLFAVTAAGHIAQSYNLPGSSTSWTAWKATSDWSHTTGITATYHD